MTGLLAIRNHFGLSQANIALFLGVSISTIKMVETGDRMLPRTAATRFAYIVQCFATYPAPGQAQIESAGKKEEGMATGELNRYIKDTTLLVRQLEQQLHTMQTTYQQALNRQALLNRFETDAPLTGSDTPWLNLLSATTLRELTKNGLKIQAVLQWKIDTHKYGLQKALQLEQQFATG